MVPTAEFTSYYGKPVLNAPVWESPRHRRLPVPRRPGRRLVAARRGAELTGRPALARAAKAGAAGAIGAVAGRARPRPRPAGAVPQHAAGVQADLADERRLLAAGRLRARPPAWPRPAALTGRLPRLGAAATAGAGAARPGRRRLHRRADQPTPPCPPGTTATARCRSSSPARPRWPPAGSACSPRPPAESRPGPQPGPARRGHGDGRVRADDAPHGHGRRAVPDGPRRRVHPGRQGAGRARGGGRAAGTPRCAAGAAGSSAALSGAALLGRVRRHPLGHLPRRAGLGRRPEVHRRPAAAAAAADGSP